jgi:catechol 2,3-dioxygenase
MKPEGVGLVRLRVRDLGRVLGFYRDLLGLAVSRTDGSSVWLAPSAVEERGAEPILRLDEDPAAPPRPDRTTGLFHVALLVPSRRALAGVLARLRDRRAPIHGASDHAVSEALYLEDPEGNGIEIYADRPRSAWREHHGELSMTTEPLDVDGLLAELNLEPRTSNLERTGHREPRTLNQTGLPSGPVVGHIHLQVSDLAAAEQFYAGVLGFDVTVRNYPGALFLSAGGYHHHVAVNVWSSRRAPRPPMGAAGLVEFEVLVSGAPETPRLKDPDGHVIVIRAAGRSAGTPAS